VPGVAQSGRLSRASKARDGLEIAPPLERDGQVSADVRARAGRASVRQKATAQHAIAAPISWMRFPWMTLPTVFASTSMAHAKQSMTLFALK
jgi:hypothetical protein